MKLFSLKEKGGGHGNSKYEFTHVDLRLWETIMILRRITTLKKALSTYIKLKSGTEKLAIVYKPKPHIHRVINITQTFPKVNATAYDYKYKDTTESYMSEYVFFLVFIAFLIFIAYITQLDNY